MAEETPRLKIHDPRYMKARALVAELKKRNWPQWSKDRNVVGMAFGQRTVGDEVLDEPALIVFVVRKTSENFIRTSRVLPRRLYIGGDYVAVDVRETGVFYPLAFTARERPATAGISIGNINEASAGTFGAVVIDNTDDAECILSNNHVMARQNAAAIGEDIVQPGPFDGGTASDDIATLRRFVTINATGNTVDGAIAAINNFGTDAIDQVHDNIIGTASPGHPAVGLLFAGGCNTTIMNPIANVLKLLDVRFPNANATIGADIGMSVEKVGRTTEYTTSTVREIDATVTIGYDFGDATFDNQITTWWMSDSGDSGSVVYRGGEGGQVDNCKDCFLTNTASTILAEDLSAEKVVAQRFRDKFLRQTLIGRWAVEVFDGNSRTFNARMRETKFDREDVDFSRHLFRKYRDEAVDVFARGEKSEQRITDDHIRDARQALDRAQKYMSGDERDASERLFKLGAELTRGKSTREALGLLNDKKLFEEVREIVAQVRSLNLDR
jgi:hypothetical protein